MAEVTYELMPNTDYDKYSFPHINRYKDHIVYTSDGETFFETYVIPEVAIDRKDIYHQIKSGEESRWDLISYKYYKTVSYWWLICLANNISDPFDSPPAGTIVRVPSLNYLTRGI